jgi:Gamma-glutamyltransferase
MRSEKVYKFLHIPFQSGDISSDDLKKHESTFQEPTSTNFEGFNVYETAPNSQAATVILWLNIIDSISANPTLHDILRSGLVAYSERDRLIADPAFLPLPSGFSTKEFAREVSMNGPSPNVTEVGSGDKGDTTYFSITDTDGNSISVIQSNYMGFGSGIVPKGTGLVLQNRGTYFSLDPKHHNSLSQERELFILFALG